MAIAAPMITPLPQGASIVSKKKKASPKDQVWLDAQKRYGLSDVHIRMARELGLNPKKFGKLANTRQEPWKAPLPEFIEKIYAKRFGKARPDKIQPSRPPVPREESDQ